MAGPWACSWPIGSKMYAPVAERHPQPFSTPAAHARVQEDDTPSRSLLAAPAFWIGGALSMAVWTGIALVVLR